MKGKEEEGRGREDWESWPVAREKIRREEREERGGRSYQEVREERQKELDKKLGRRPPE